VFTEPSWLTTARRLIGTQEIAGKSSNPVILGWAAALKPWVQEFYKDDDIPWCGLFVGYCLQVNKIEPPKDVLAARAYASWGEACDPAIPGTILSFSRNGGGHVGFYVAEDEHHYHVLGGNQSNTVNVARIAKSRCIGKRWPTGHRKPWFAKPVWRTASGPVSTNEA
jgi:uncharacterized protein (TIGR02594 family)